jgi:hypothetical protein
VSVLFAGPLAKGASVTLPLTRLAESFGPLACSLYLKYVGLKATLATGARLEVAFSTDEGQTFGDWREVVTAYPATSSPVYGKSSEASRFVPLDGLFALQFRLTNLDAAHDAANVVLELREAVVT